MFWLRNEKIKFVSHGLQILNTVCKPATTFYGSKFNLMKTKNFLKEITKYVACNVYINIIERWSTGDIYIVNYM